MCTGGTQWAVKAWLKTNGSEQLVTIAVIQHPSPDGARAYVRNNWFNPDAQGLKADRTALWKTRPEDLFTELHAPGQFQLAFTEMIAV